jgi:hypothetical protein
MVRTKNTKSLLIVLTVALAANVMADPLPGDCTNGASIANIASSCSLGGTIFSNFTYKVSGGGADLAPTADQVFIQFVNTVLSPQLMFSADPTWNLNGPDGGKADNSYNVFIDFDVLAPANFVVSGIGLSATGFDMQGSAAKVVETVVSGSGTSQLQVSGFPTTTTTLSDSVSIDGAQQIHVTKKIQLSNGNGQGNEFDSVSQTFTLTDPPAPVPEPASMLLIGSGLIAVTFMRRIIRASAHRTAIR